jgi:hypothetical protein
MVLCVQLEEKSWTLQITRYHFCDADHLFITKFEKIASKCQNVKNRATDQLSDTAAKSRIFTNRWRWRALIG